MLGGPRTRSVASKRKAIENAYQPLTPDVLPDWTSDTSLISWLDTLGK